jgi:hypothetical protein
MGFKIVDDKVIDTDADTAQSRLIDGRPVYTCGLFVKWAGVTGTGSVILEGSANGVDWFALKTRSVTGASGAETETLDVNHWNFLRVSHVIGTLSAGTVEAWFNSKGQ